MISVSFALLYCVASFVIGIFWGYFIFHADEKK